MTIKKILKYVIALFLFPTFCLAQSNFKPGYIVTLKGDTLKGNIDYREWYQNPRNLRFESPDGQVKVYNAINTLAFGVNDNVAFKRFTLEMSTDQIELGRLSIGVDSTRMLDTVFLKKVAAGKYLSLYKYVDYKTRYFTIDNRTGKIAELIMHVYCDIKNRDNIITLNTYRNQLLQYAYSYSKDYQLAMKKINTVSYSNDLIEVIDLINGETKVQRKAPSEGGYRFFAGTALNSGYFQYVGSAGNLVKSPSSKNIYYFDVSAGIDLFINPEVGRLIFRAELGYSPNKTFETYALESSQTVKQQTLSISPQMMYNFFNSQVVKVYGAVGFSLNFSKNSSIYTYQKPGDRDYEVKTDYPQLRSSWMQLPFFRAGVTFKNSFDIYGSYALPAALSNNYANFEGRIYGFKIGIHYLLEINKTK